ncbi:hypothetical protein PVAG01_06769 [Phlyctema vagabunda]|uniref:non-specific serine/threonine protein kinase n=1 Tax=Phlyctema vagabunda TaxID=108571 RepID=A0ABR4PH19_9HELO
MPPTVHKWQKEWQNKSDQWERQWPEWRPVRFLGRGGTGTVGLWEGIYEGVKRNVVVKQIGYGDIDALGFERGKRVRTPILDRRSAETESTIMETSQRNNGTDHIVKIYEKAHLTQGTGTHRTADPKNKKTPVIRMFMEYCDQGDLFRFLEENADENSPIYAESSIWAVWECLARALVVLEHGCEDPDTHIPDPNWRPIAHFDIKPENIFRGGDDIQDPNAHSRPLGIFKLGDFGLAKVVPVQQTEEWFEGVRWRGTPGWHAPEAMHQGTEKKIIGQSTNTFAMAKVIYFMVTNKELDITKRINFTNPDLANAVSFYTYGTSLIGPDASAYSKKLRTLLLRCLAHDQENRPAALPLLKEIFEVRRDYADHPTDEPSSVPGRPPPSFFDPEDPFKGMDVRLPYQKIAEPKEFEVTNRSFGSYHSLSGNHYDP